MVRRECYLLLTIFSLLAVCASQLRINADPVSCRDPIFGPGGPSKYTPRNDRSCCYDAVTRPLCCMAGKVGTLNEVCNCDSRISCGNIPSWQKRLPTTPINRPHAPVQYQPQASPQSQPRTPSQYQPPVPQQYQPQAPLQYQPPASPQYQPQVPPHFQPQTQQQYQPQALPHYQRPASPQYQSQVATQFQPPLPPQYQPQAPQQYQPSTQYQPAAPQRFQPQLPLQYQPPIPPQYQPVAPPQYYPFYKPQYQPQSPLQYQLLAQPQYQPFALPQYQPPHNYYPPLQYNLPQRYQPSLVAPAPFQPTGMRPWPQGTQDKIATTSLCTHGARALGGTKVADYCEFHGVANITTLQGRGVTCNAVYVVADVDGVLKRSFLTTEWCKNLVDDVGGELKMEVMIGTRRYPTVVVFKSVSGPNGNAFLDPTPAYEAQFKDFGPCQRPACPYNPERMRNLVDMNDCRLVSYGASNREDLLFNGLNQVPVRLSVTGCQTPSSNSSSLSSSSSPDSILTTCYQSTDNTNLLCSGDGGAPVFCLAPQTREWILMGVTQLDEQSCAASTEVRVIPYPIPELLNFRS